jgi:hypothetical protein
LTTTSPAAHGIEDGAVGVPTLGLALGLLPMLDGEPPVPVVAPVPLSLVVPAPLLAPVPLVPAAPPPVAPPALPVLPPPLAPAPAPAPPAAPAPPPAPPPAPSAVIGANTITATRRNDNVVTIFLSLSS